MKHILKLASLVFVLGMTLSCSEDDLLLLENIPMFTDDGSPRVLARPESVLISGDYNHELSITWPIVSPAVEKAEVTIVSGGETKVFEITNFEEDFILFSENLLPHDVSVVYISKNGSRSNPTKKQVTPKEYEVDEIARNVVAKALSGEVEFAFKNQLKSNYKYFISYNYKGQVTEREFDSRVGATGDTLLVSDLLDDQYAYPFSVKVKDVTRDLISQVVTLERTPLTLPYILVSRTFTGANLFDVGKVSWTNISGKPVKVNLSVVINGIPQLFSKTSALASDNISVPNLIAGVNYQFKLLTESVESGFLSEEKTIAIATTASSYTYQEFNTKALKVDAGWVQSASSSHKGDGDAVNGLIDGNIGTYWQSVWNPATPYPHHVTFTLPVHYKFNKIVITNRDHSTPNPYKDFSVQVSDDGVNFTTKQSFVNTESRRATAATFNITTPIVSKYVRLLFTSSLPGFHNGVQSTTPTNNLNISEVSFGGYKETY